MGPQRLPELARTIGRALREFRKVQDDVKDTVKFDLNDEPEPNVRPKKPRPPGACVRPERRGRRHEDGAVSESAKALPDANGSWKSSRRKTFIDAPSDAESDPEPRATE